MSCSVNTVFVKNISSPERIIRQAVPLSGALYSVAAAQVFLSTRWPESAAGRCARGLLLKLLGINNGQGQRHNESDFNPHELTQLNSLRSCSSGYFKKSYQKEVTKEHF